jgi:very-short-patch-repair endonuclease
MILDTYLLEKAKKYCAIKGIRIIDGKIPQQYMGEVTEFLVRDQVQSRRFSKINEKVNRLKCNTTVQDLMSKLKIESPIEEVLRNALVVEGFGKHLRTQFEIGTKRVDFAFPIARLVIEADGKEYHRGNQDQLDRDMQRDKYLARKGWRVLHIEGTAIRRNIRLCIDKIKEELGETVLT